MLSSAHFKDARFHVFMVSLALIMASCSSRPLCGPDASARLLVDVNIDGQAENVRIVEKDSCLSDGAVMALFEDVKRNFLFGLREGAGTDGPFADQTLVLEFGSNGSRN